MRCPLSKQNSASPRYCSLTLHTPPTACEPNGLSIAPKIKMPTTRDLCMSVRAGTVATAPRLPSAPRPPRRVSDARVADARFPKSHPSSCRETQGGRGVVS